MGTEKLNKFDFIWKVLEGPDLKKEYRFDPRRKWRVDYFHPSSGIAIEIEGAVWTRGRHTRPMGFLKDMEKYNRLAELGILLFRIPAHQITARWVNPVLNAVRNRKLFEC